MEEVRTVELEEAGEAAGGEVAAESGLDGEVEQAALLPLPLPRPPRALVHRQEP